MRELKIESRRPEGTWMVGEKSMGPRELSVSEQMKSPWWVLEAGCLGDRRAGPAANTTFSFWSV